MFYFFSYFSYAPPLSSQMSCLLFSTNSSNFISPDAKLFFFLLILIFAETLFSLFSLNFRFAFLTSFIIKTLYASSTFFFIFHFSSNTYSFISSFLPTFLTYLELKISIFPSFSLSSLVLTLIVLKIFEMLTQKTVKVEHYANLM